jgi:hypothetical protein
VLHRKNALFYRTLHGAEAGDLFMSLIHTCELTGANPAACTRAGGESFGADAVELPRDAEATHHPGGPVI